MEALDTQRIIINGNVSLSEGRGRERIYRVLSLSEKFCYVIELGIDIGIKENGLLLKKFQSNPPNKKTRNRFKWSRDYFEKSLADGTLINTYEHAIPPEMQKEIPKGVDPGLDTRRAVVKMVDDLTRGRHFEDSVVYSKALKEASERNAIGLNTAREQYEMHLFYGGHVNALMDHYWLRGGRGKGRRHLHCALGRKTGAEKDFNNTRHKRRRITAKIYSEYSNFIKTEAYKNNDKFPSIFHRWITSRIAANRDKEGNIVYYPVDESRFPGDDNMKRIGRKLLKEFRLERDQEKAPRTGSRGGSSLDIVHKQLTVWDIDSTTADNFLKFGDRNIKIDGVGKPTVTLATCRSSNAITGWYVSFGPENGDAYLNTVFCGATDKYRELYRWKVPHLKGMVTVCPSEVILDRGPGISMRTQTSLVTQFRVRSKMAQPGTPEGKGAIEQVMFYFQDALKDIAGSVFDTGDKAENYKRRKLARKNAVTLEQFMQALLCAISRRNLEMDVSHLLTPEMMKENVPASPCKIFEFNKQYSRGDAAWDWDITDIFKRLCIQSEKNAPKGVITLNKLEFTSPELQIFSRNYGKINNNRSAKVKIYEIPNAPFLLLWELPGGELGILDATSTTKKMYEDGYGFSIKFQNNYRKHLFAEAKWISRRETINTQIILSREEQDKTAAYVSKAKQKDIEKVELHAEDLVPCLRANAVPRKQAQLVSEYAHAASILEAVLPGQKIPTPQVNSMPRLNQDYSSINDKQDLFID